MSSPASVILQLEIDRAGERITGRLASPTGPPVPFSGWLGLAAAIEHATAADATEKMGNDPSSHGARDGTRRRT